MARGSHPEKGTSADLPAAAISSSPPTTSDSVGPSAATPSRLAAAVKHVRNIAIVLALATLVYASPQVGFAAGLLSWLLGIVFLGVIAWFLYVMYRSYRAELQSLGDGVRAVLYGSIGLAALTLTATPTLWGSGTGTIVWFALLAAATYGLFASWRAYRRY